ncbi:MAG: biopolymer transporter ExbD [Chryseobacterium sp.]|nr:MAG: biopolymer transporter ExbD [Chryseobacterium sp.]
MAEVQVQDKGGNGGKVRAKKHNTRVDMTPMVDLGFLLITFFMFTTTFSKPNVVDLKLPAKPKDNEVVKDAEIDNTNSLTLILGKDNRIFWHQLDRASLNSPDKLNETTYDRDGIEKIIDDAKRRAKNRDNFTVIIKPTEDSNYRNFVDVLDEMSITKTERYGVGEINPVEQAVYNQKVGQ